MLKIKKVTCRETAKYTEKYTLSRDLDLAIDDIISRDYPGYHGPWGELNPWYHGHPTITVTLTECTTGFIQKPLTFDIEYDAEEKQYTDPNFNGAVINW